jgi:spore coat protein U-like protein
MNKAKLASAISAAMVAAMVTGPAAATTTSTGSLSVASSVASSCVVSATSTLNFGAYDPVGANASTALPGTGSVSIKCTKGSSAVTIDLGAGANAVSTQRKMLGVTNAGTLNYSIVQPEVTTPYSDCSGSTVWGSTVGGSVYTPTVAAWSATAASVFSVCGSVPAGQDVSVDTSYQDTIVVTVSF